jgi:hypothetical protein
MNLTEGQTHSHNPQMEINMQPVPDCETFSSIYIDTDSVSTLNPTTPSDKSSTLQPSPVFTPRIITKTSPDDSDSVSKISDADSRLSSLEYNFSKFQSGPKDIKRQAKKEAQQNAQTLASILELLHTNRKGGTYLHTSEHKVPSDRRANHPEQMPIASGSIGSAGSGS